MAQKLIQPIADRFLPFQRFQFFFFLEKHINKHLVAFLNKYRVIHTNQSGFRQNNSCQTALVKLIDQWMTCIDRGDIVGSVFLDFRKAFDLVDHSILADILSLYKCQGPDLNLISSYLQSRQQVIDSGKGLSTTAYGPQREKMSFRTKF